MALDAVVQQCLARALASHALVVVWNLWLQHSVAAVYKHLQATQFLSQISC